jgi:hypothetical protein
MWQGIFVMTLGESPKTIKDSVHNPINIIERKYFNYSHWFQWSKGNKSE